MKRVVVLISGNGSNLQAIIDSMERKEVPNAQITLVISNKKEAFGLERAKKHNIATKYFPLKPYLDSKTRSQFDLDLAQVVNGETPDLIVLAGWMLILSPNFLDSVKAPVINLHPALPGQFAGTHAIERAHSAYQEGKIQHTGVMVHRVIPEIDAGETILSEVVPIHPEDTLEALEDRMHQTEHRILVAAIRKILIPRVASSSRAEIKTFDNIQEECPKRLLLHSSYFNLGKFFSHNSGR
ncbi:phosphoribosylglycinamide formyltransferase [Planoprotostelium fungivorum]|uniref:Phosphoribosylglycinamide formyltransferase n=1 Tax=Planoprotostelium fungivorum TaxID=1890364 RepID=A0A2P6MUS2_9EUKA|nr:phosphoribosylglycinamide formyltransferase [Planoprotostelium fungivorum]